MFSFSDYVYTFPNPWINSFNCDVIININHRTTTNTHANKSWVDSYFQLYVCMYVCVCVYHSLVQAKPLDRSWWKFAHILTSRLGKNGSLRFSIKICQGCQILFSPKKWPFLLFFNISLDIIELESWSWCPYIGFRWQGIKRRYFEKCRTNRVAGRVARSLIFNQKTTFLLFFNVSIEWHRRWFPAVLTARQLVFNLFTFMNKKISIQR